MGQVPTLGAPFRRKEIIIKIELRETQRGGGAGTPQHIGGIEKGSPNRDEDQSSLMNPVRLNLMVKSTTMTVVHTLKPSSLAHSLQIHCTGLTKV